MKLKNCKECGRIFFHPTYDICERCRESEEKDFKKVKEYLWDKKGATIDEVHEETGVEKKKIIKFIREGRLIAEGLDVEIFVECKRCGEPILYGDYCESCIKELEQGFTSKLENKKKDKRTKTNKEQLFLKDRLLNRRN